MQTARDVLGHTMAETTPEVPYEAIALGKKMPWFIKMVEDLEQSEQEYPHSSHGFSRVLANVHRAHPPLSFSCALTWMLRAAAPPSVCC